MPYKKRNNLGCGLQAHVPTWYSIINPLTSTERPTAVDLEVPGETAATTHEVLVCRDNAKACVSVRAAS